ncbi:MAG: HEAT repeat domain-containing protein [Bacteroidota bacterium]
MAAGNETNFVIIAVLTMFFVGLSFTYLILLFIKKIKDKKEAYIKLKHWNDIQDALATILIQSLSTENNEGMDYHRSINLLKRSMKKSSMVCQWLLEEIMRQKSNLSGGSLKTLLKVYNELGLKSRSIKKLASRRWDTRAKGILELEQMRQKDCFTLFYPFLNAKNKDLRKVARLGLTSLAPNPLDFLKYLNEELSEWEQMNIAERLGQRPQEQLPDFSKYYGHKYSSVVSFCMNMSVNFGFYDHIPMIVSNLKHASVEVQKTAIDCLSEMGAYQAHKEIYALALKTPNEEVIIASLKYLSNVGSKKHKYLIERMLSHSSAAVRMEAVNTVIQLDLELDTMNDELKKMYLHHQNELI